MEREKCNGSLVKFIMVFGKMDFKMAKVKFGFDKEIK
jgi:hypothetical protein